MAKDMPFLPDAAGPGGLLPIVQPSPRPGMFGGASRYGRRNGLVPDIAEIPPAPYPFSPPASAIDPNAFASPAGTPPELPPLAMPAWAQAAGRNALPTGPDIQFSAPGDSRPPLPSGAPHYRQPPPEVVALAQATQRTTGIPASVNIGQWMQESGHGRHIPDGSNNYWGIKEYDSFKPNVVVKTMEYDKAGRPHTRFEPFRKFQSPEEGWAAHAQVLLHPRYAKAMTRTHDPDGFVDAIAGTYAPNNPYYAQRLKDTMRKNHLYQYNMLPPTNSK